MVSRYAELQKDYEDIKDGPRISTEIIPAQAIGQAKHQEPKEIVIRMKKFEQ